MVFLASIGQRLLFINWSEVFVRYVGSQIL